MLYYKYKGINLGRTNVMLEYIRRIAVFIILEGVILGVVQNEDYKKFIKMCSGMIMIILVLSPLDKVFGITTAINGFFKEITQQGEYREINEVMAAGIRGMTDEGMESVRGEYEKMLMEQIGEKTAEYGYIIENAEVEFDEREDNYIGSLKLLLSSEKESDNIPKVGIVWDKSGDMDNPDIMDIKNHVTDTYGIDYEKIIITVK